MFNSPALLNVRSPLRAFAPRNVLPAQNPKCVTACDAVPLNATADDSTRSPPDAAANVADSRS